MSNFALSQILRQIVFGIVYSVAGINFPYLFLLHLIFAILCRHFQAVKIMKQGIDKMQPTFQ